MENDSAARSGSGVKDERSSRLWFWDDGSYVLKQ